MKEIEVHRKMEQEEAQIKLDVKCKITNKPIPNRLILNGNDNE